MTFLKRTLTWIANHILSRNDSTGEWEKVREEGKAVREEIDKLSERAKEVSDSTE